MNPRIPPNSFTLGDKLQALVQVERQTGTFECQGFNGLPAGPPAHIVIAACNSSASTKALGDSLGRTLDGLLPSVRRHKPPCLNKTTIRPNTCHAFGVEEAEKLLVLVGDGKAVLDQHPLVPSWLGTSDRHRILPVLPRSAMINTSALLGPTLQGLNAAFYTHSPNEVVPDILSLAGLTVYERRIFISYRRSDSSELAMQLFDALAHHGFDVFLDSFRVPPGVDFQRRLMEELGHKAMLLVLESQTILNSPWTRLEIETAFKHRLGVLALHLPNGHLIDTIDSTLREELVDGDFKGGFYSTGSAQARLTDATLERVLQAIKGAYASGVVRRRNTVQGDVAAALDKSGLPQSAWHFGSTGVLEASDLFGTKKYRVWLATRSPDLTDFHGLHLATQQPSSTQKGVVVGTTSLLHTSSLQRVAWLAGRCDVTLVDLFDFEQTAEKIAKGTL